jgi:hypothetical protein
MLRYGLLKSPIGLYRRPDPLVDLLQGTFRNPWQIPTSPTWIFKDKVTPACPSCRYRQTTMAMIRAIGGDPENPIVLLCEQGIPSLEEIQAMRTDPETARSLYRLNYH